MSNLNVLSEQRQGDKGFLALGMLLLALALAPSAARSDELTPTAQARLFWAAPFMQLGRMSAAPLGWDGQGWAVAGALGLGVAATINNDLSVRGAWRGGREDLNQVMPKLGLVGEGYVFGTASALTWGLGAAIGDAKLAETSAVALQALAVSGMLTAGFKQAFGSVRPSSYDNDHRFWDYQRPYGQLSFPSGHSNSAFALAEAWGASYGRWWTYPIAAAVAYSRVYENHHWPSDVLFGAVLGAWTGHTAVVQARERGAPSRLWSLAPLPDRAGLTATLRF